MPDPIDALVADLAPVRRLRARHVIAPPVIVTVAAAIVIASIGGLRADLMLGQPDPMFLLRGGVLLLLGVATMLSVTAMARPAVGKAHAGWQWALAAALLFPASAFIVAMIHMPDGIETLSPRTGLECLGFSAASALAIGASIAWSLRRGAPTSLARAGWLTGLASGSLGAFAYSLCCPFNDIVYIGLWYSLAVAISAVAGRLILPTLIRW